MQQSNKPIKNLNKRTFLTFFITFLMIPLAIFFGVIRLGGQNYYIISLMIVFYAMLPFFMIFEKRRPQARELVIIAVLSAIAVAGRAAFFFVPQIKPMAAFIIITGVCLGAESGFLVGAISAFVSNFFFGQGAWTPSQIYGFAMIGLLSGLLFKTKIFPAKKLPISIFGGFFTFFVYGIIVDIDVFLRARVPINLMGFLTVYASSFYFNLIHAAATVIFLFFLAEPMIKKLDRIKTKYGFLE